MGCQRRHERPGYRVVVVHLAIWPTVLHSSARCRTWTTNNSARQRSQQLLEQHCLQPRVHLISTLVRYVGRDLRKSTFFIYTMVYAQRYIGRCVSDIFSDIFPGVSGLCQQFTKRLNIGIRKHSICIVTFTRTRTRSRRLS